MKLSISIPDLLWIKAQILEPELSPSQLVQKALSNLIDQVEFTDEMVLQAWKKLTRE